MPTLEEFQDLYRCIPDKEAFPPALMQNQSLFLSGIAALTQQQRVAFWRFFKLLHVNRFSAYFTGTADDLGVRIGSRNPSQSDADLVLCRLFFPSNGGPYCEINARTIGRRAFPKLQRQNIFTPQGLSPTMEQVAIALEEVVPSSPKVLSFLDDAIPYDHMATKKLLADRLPISHPIGGLSAGGARFSLKQSWLEAGP